MSSSDTPTNVPTSLINEAMVIEFSRPFSLEKVGNVGSVKFQISANTEELAALAKRLEISVVRNFEVVFNIKKSKGLGGRNKGFDVDGSAVAEVVRCESGPSKDMVQTVEFSLKLQLIEGDEETYLKDIDWKAESVKDYDIEFYQNFQIDLGEIATQYLSLELDPFILLDDSALSPFEIQEIEESKAAELKVNPFLVLEKLKIKKDT